ncbi:hypothetical protein [Xanthocytophaga agilis]|uniref:DUF3592 domain-containing protein n=1 Tax=Xanthocytophaga agilis TaxID=3048010 RepID=A0AAE3UCV0_9BACT|nr:hypothetical protein [Xanthocytophaga agilis]MDJ1500505.1 hypothetical protein [Xanthocytophaga agilis]
MDWDISLLNPTEVDRFGVKYKYTQATLTDIRTIDMKVKSELPTYAFYYRFQFKNQSFTGVSFQEENKRNLPHIGDTLKIQYVVSNPASSCVLGMRTRSGNLQSIFISWFMLLFGIGALFICFWLGKRHNYLMQYGHLAVGKFDQQIETSDSGGDKYYEVQYQFVAFNRQFYYATQKSYFPVYEEDVVILYKEENPQYNKILQVHKLYEEYDENFQPLSASWDEIFFHSCIPVGMFIGLIYIYIVYC